MVATELPINVKTKNIFKYDYFTSFVLCWKNAQFTDNSSNKKIKNSYV